MSEFLTCGFACADRSVFRRFPETLYMVYFVHGLLRHASGLVAAIAPKMCPVWAPVLSPRKSGPGPWCGRFVRLSKTFFFYLTVLYHRVIGCLFLSI